MEADGVAYGGLSERSPTSPEALLEHWLPLKTRRHTWVFLERGRIVGLVSLRNCGHPAAWQIDCLQSEFQGSLLRLPEDLGFDRIAECSSLMKEISVKATQPQFMPIRA